MFAIRCFNVETGLVGETVKETGLLPIRMQWWKDAVNSVYRDKPVKHPVIQALAQVWVAKTWPVLGLFSLMDTQFHCGITKLANSRSMPYAGASYTSLDQVSFTEADQH